MPAEPIGAECARELVAALKLIAGAVVDTAEADLRSRSNPDTEIVRSGAPARYFAWTRFGPKMRSPCVGIVSQAHVGDPQRNSLQLDRDGVLRWRWG